MFINTFHKTTLFKLNFHKSFGSFSKLGGIFVCRPFIFPVGLTKTITRKQICYFINALQIRVELLVFMQASAVSTVSTYFCRQAVMHYCVPVLTGII